MILTTNNSRDRRFSYLLVNNYESRRIFRVLCFLCDSSGAPAFLRAHKTCSNSRCFLYHQGSPRRVQRELRDTVAKMDTGIYIFETICPMSFSSDLMCF